MKVLHLYMPAFIPKITGFDRFLFKELVHRAGESGDEHGVICCRAPFQLDGMRYFTIGAGHPIDATGVLDRIGEWGPDVLHAHDGFTGRNHAVDLANSLNLPLVVSVHGSDVMRTTKGSDRKYAKLWDRASLVICNSEFLREYVIRRRGCPAEKTRIVHPGTSTKLKQHNHAYRHNSLNVIIVARLIPFKNVEDAIQAVALSPQVNELVVVGSGPEYKRLKALAANDSRVMFTGIKSHSETLRYISQADVLISCSKPQGDGTCESLGVSVIEAGMQGIPVICYQQGGMLAGYSENDGPAIGAYLTRRDQTPEWIADCLRDLSSKSELEWARMSNAIRETMAVQYGTEANTTALLSAYNELINE